jgi:hypothetical protein
VANAASSPTAFNARETLILPPSFAQ